jgi:hypothetical protein
VRLAAGATIVVVLVVFFLAALAAGPGTRAVARLLDRRRAAESAG